MADQLARILAGVETAPDRFAKLFENCIAELPTGDFIDALELADLMLNNRQAILWALITKH